MHTRRGQTTRTWNTEHDVRAGCDHERQRSPMSSCRCSRALFVGALLLSICFPCSQLPRYLLEVCSYWRASVTVGVGRVHSDGRQHPLLHVNDHLECSRHCCCDSLLPARHVFTCPTVASYIVELILNRSAPLVGSIPAWPSDRNALLRLSSPPAIAHARCTQGRTSGSSSRCVHACRYRRSSNSIDRDRSSRRHAAWRTRLQQGVGNEVQRSENRGESIT
jgi:hypothetical protein